VIPRTGVFTPFLAKRLFSLEAAQNLHHFWPGMRLFLNGLSPDFLRGPGEIEKAFKEI
jgi:hypothetical protein